MTTRSASSLIALRQLACLGFPGRALFLDLCAVIDTLIGFETAQAVFLDERLGIADVLFTTDMPPSFTEELAEYFTENPRGDGAVITAAVAFSRGYRVLRHSQLVSPKQMHSTEFYHRFGQPHGVHWVAQMHLLDDRSPIASLSFARPNGTRDFSAADEAVLVRAEPWIAHALAYPGPFQEGQEITDWHGSDRGALVLDENGHLVASCSTGYRLLQQAAGVGATGRRDARLAVDALAKRLVDTVLSSLRGRGVEPPLLVVLNPYGRFKLRAYCLETFFEGQTPQVALHIERQIPTSLRLFRSPRFLSLAPRERDVCLWLVRGRTTGEIAALLGIKPASVIHYTRSLYARLKVGSKRDLLLALLGPTED